MECRESMKHERCPSQRQITLNECFSVVQRPANVLNFFPTVALIGMKLQHLLGFVNV